MRAVLSRRRDRRRASMRAARQPVRGRPVSCSPGSAATTPSRTMIQPARIRRRYAPMVLMPDGFSDLPAGMERRDAAGVIAPGDAAEAGPRYHGGEIVLVREFAYRLHQITIWFTVAGNDIADTRNDVER